MSGRDRRHRQRGARSHRGRDAICCFAAGIRSRGQDHRQGVGSLQEVTGDATSARALREVLDLADAGHHGLSNVSVSNGTAALRRARTLVEAAGERVR